MKGFNVSHEEALNLILANSCGQYGDSERQYKEWYAEHYEVPIEEFEKDIRIVEFDLCCATAVVVAELINNDPIQYKIISVKIK